MDDKYLEYIDDLNNDDASIRLESIKKLKDCIDKGEIERPKVGNDVNNHVHTTYSFSPYSPSKAVWMAYNAGLAACGIMDHDTVSGAREFIDAGKIIGLATTIGFECRASFIKTSLNGRILNNPEQNSIAYISIHGVPHTRIDQVNEYLEKFRAKRNIRNARMVDKINEILKSCGMSIDFEKDIKPLSKHDEGGSITERHILYGLGFKLIERFGMGRSLVDFLTDDMKLYISAGVEGYLLDSNNAFYVYDLLGALKSEMVSMFYIDAADECPDALELTRFSDEIGAISSYAYRGDVIDSVTGDKKSKRFEDGFLDILFDTLKKVGFNAVTYMPSRNTIEQLRRIKSLCEQYEFLQISGEDINSPRQPFICTAAREEEFKNLYDSTWALIGHEKAATEGIDKGMFSKATVLNYPDLEERIMAFKGIGIR